MLPSSSTITVQVCCCSFLKKINHLLHCHIHIHIHIHISKTTAGHKFDPASSLVALKSRRRRWIRKQMVLVRKQMNQHDMKAQTIAPALFSSPLLVMHSGARTQTGRTFTSGRALSTAMSACITATFEAKSTSLRVYKMLVGVQGTAW
eukprot:557368-Pelagomonas_calceolata.AAC.1